MAFSKEQIKDFKSRILEETSQGASLSQIMAQKGYPKRNTVYKWLTEDETFANKDAQAREERADKIFEEMIEIADTVELGDTIEDDGKRTTKRTGDMVQHRKLRIDTRKWILSRMNPKKYGDKASVDIKTETPIFASINLELKEPGEE